MYESHVQHPVRFVQYEEFECFQANETLVDQVLQSSGSCNQYLYSTFQFICLWLLSYTAEDDGMSQPGILTVCTEAFSYLYGQLAGRRQNECFDTFAVIRFI